MMIFAAGINSFPLNAMEAEISIPVNSTVKPPAKAPIQKSFLPELRWIMPEKSRQQSIAGRARLAVLTPRTISPP